VELFGFAGPALAFGFGEAGEQVVADLLGADAADRGDAQEWAPNAGLPELWGRSVPRPLIRSFLKAESVMSEESQPNVPEREPVRLPPQYCDFA
jgi:hypothetical protein